MAGPLPTKCVACGCTLLPQEDRKHLTLCADCATETGKWPDDPDIEARVQEIVRRPYRYQFFWDETAKCYVAQVVELEGCHSVGAHRAEAFENILEAQELYIESMIRRGYESEIPPPTMDPPEPPDQTEREVSDMSDEKFCFEVGKFYRHKGINEVVHILTSVNTTGWSSPTLVAEAPAWTNLQPFGTDETATQNYEEISSEEYFQVWYDANPDSKELRALAGGGDTTPPKQGYQTDPPAQLYEGHEARNGCAPLDPQGDKDD